MQGGDESREAESAVPAAAAAPPPVVAAAAAAAPPSPTITFAASGSDMFDLCEWLDLLLLFFDSRIVSKKV